MEHARLAQISSDIVSVFEEFCKVHILQWLEVLSVMGAIDLRICEGLHGVQSALKVYVILLSVCSFSQFPIAGYIATKSFHGARPSS